MAKKSKSSKKVAKKAAPAKADSSRKTKSAPLRFAHPFFTSTPAAQRKVSPATNTKSMAQFASQKLGPIPKPTGDSSMELKDTIGQPGTDEIQAAGTIRFHATG